MKRNLYYERALGTLSSGQTMLPVRVKNEWTSPTKRAGKLLRSMYTLCLVCTGFWT